jgi:hypothetical protein
MTPRAVIEVAHRADGYLRGFRPDPRRALEVIQSVPEDAEFAGADPQADRIARCALCAVTGDCYRLLGEVTTAADWYRRAAGHWQGGLGYPFFYADLVVQHRLSRGAAGPVRQKLSHTAPTSGRVPRRLNPCSQMHSLQPVSKPGTRRLD